MICETPDKEQTHQPEINAGCGKPTVESQSCERPIYNLSYHDISPLTQVYFGIDHNSDMV